MDGLAGDLSESQREYLGISLRNAKHLGSMIGDLMEVTRAQSGKLRVLCHNSAHHHAALR